MNQDAFEVILADSENWSRTGHRFIVADGMGAHAAGELASQLAVEQVSDEYERNSSAHKESLESAFKTANAVIYERGREDTQLYNMGTTCSALILLPNGALIGHVGDSRVYRCRGPKIQQLTFDHSLVWEMRAVGQLSDESRCSAVPRNVITRCLGPHPEVDVDIEGLFSIQPGDTFVLCSDGLTGRIDDSEIGAIAQHLEPEAATQFLIDLANLRGGSDNITVITTRVLSEQLAAPGEVSDSKRAPPTETHPGWWFAAAGGLATALLSYRYGLSTVALAGGVVFLVAGFGAAIQWLQDRQRDAQQKLVAPPYAEASATVDQTFIDSVCDTLELALESMLAKAPQLSDLQPAIGRIRQGNTGSSPRDICQELASIAHTVGKQLEP